MRRSPRRTRVSPGPVPERKTVHLPMTISEFDSEVFGRIAALIESAATVAVSGHTDPDGDALGSGLALTAIIEAKWPRTRVQPLLANDRPVVASYRFLPGVERFVPARRYHGTPDLFISVDTPMPGRLKDAEAVFKRARTTAAFDHHPTMEAFAQVNYLRASAASVGDVVYDFMTYLGVEPTPAIATCILTAVLTDTGRFQYQNTDAHALRAAAAMVEAGASPAEVSENVYMSDSMAALKLREIALGRLATDPSGTVSYSYVTQEDLKSVGATAEDCDGLIDVPRCLRGVGACLLLREQKDGTVRGNVRSKAPWVDVSAVAAKFGGGGHRAAAGLTFKGPMERALSEVVDALVAQVAVDAASQGEVQ